MEPATGGGTGTSAGGDTGTGSTTPGGFGVVTLWFTLISEKAPDMGRLVWVVDVAMIFLRVCVNYRT